jgi:multicomponent Na+:H+ antiporter subunit B
MHSLILHTATRFLTPLLLAFSVVVLFRGHNAPGGGFVGGLLGASAFALWSLGAGVKEARRYLHYEPQSVIGAGLLIAALSGLTGVFYGQPYLTGRYITIHFPLIGDLKLGTVMAFDVGVYLVVVGSVLMMIFTLSEE